MIKLLVNAPDGVQRLLKINLSGAYFDRDRVLWDEREDGQFPADKLDKIGGLVRNGANLDLDQALLDAHNAARQGELEAANAKRAEIIDLKDKLKAGTAIASEVQRAVFLLMKKVASLS